MTADERLALMDDQVWEGGLPIDPDLTSEASQSQTLFGFPFAMSASLESASADVKLALMEWGTIWEEGIPIDPSTPFDTGDKLQLIYDYPHTVIVNEVEPEPGPTRRGELESELRVRRANPEDSTRSS